MNAATVQARVQALGLMPMLGLAPRQRFRIQPPCAPTTWHRHHRRESCWGGRRLAMSSSVLYRTNTLRAFRPSKQRQEHLVGFLAYRLVRQRPQQQRDLG